MFRDIPATALTWHAVMTGFAGAVFQHLFSGFGQKTFGSEAVRYPGYLGQEERIRRSGEWQVREGLEESRLAAGETLPEEVCKDSEMECKLTGSLKRYDWEPTNELFFDTFKKVINNLHKAPRCYEVLSELNKKHNHIRHEIVYHPYYVDLTYFMCGKTLHQMNVGRTFINPSLDSLIGTTYHELIAHGSQAVELINRGKMAGMRRARIMKQWERELEGYLIKWFSLKEMYADREIRTVQSDMKRWMDAFPEWVFFRIKDVEKLEVESVIRALLAHYQEKYRNDDWVNTTYLHKLVG